MLNDPKLDRNDSLGVILRSAYSKMNPPPALEKAVKTGVPYTPRANTAIHVRRFAKAIVSYALCIVLLVGGVYLIPPLFGVQSPFASSSPVLSFTPENQPEVNYNNYEEGNGENHIDYRDGRFAFLKGSTLTIVDSENRTQKLKGIDAPFQLMNDSVIYIKNEKLIIRSIEEDESKTIAENVRHFIATDQCIVYEIDDERDVESNLYVYDLATEEPQWIAKDVLKFFIYRQDVLICDYNNRLCKISLADYSKTELIEIQPHNWPCTMQMQENLLFIENTNELLILDLDTNEYRTIEFADRNGGLNYQSLIVSDSYVFASFQYQKSIDYLFTYPADHESNGLWKIDPQTLEKEKICDESFVQLYLFGDHLYGERNGKLYEIDWQNKQIMRIEK